MELGSFLICSIHALQFLMESPCLLSARVQMATPANHVKKLAIRWRTTGYPIDRLSALGQTEHPKRTNLSNNYNSLWCNVQSNFEHPPVGVRLFKFPAKFSLASCGFIMKMQRNQWIMRIYLRNTTKNREDRIVRHGRCSYIRRLFLVACVPLLNRQLSFIRNYKKNISACVKYNELQCRRSLYVHSIC